MFSLSQYNVSFRFSLLAIKIYDHTEQRGEQMQSLAAWRVHLWCIGGKSKIMNWHFLYEKVE